MFGCPLNGGKVTPWIGYRAVGFIFLSAILFIGTIATFGPILFAASFCSFIWNFFFIPPQFTFEIKEPEDVMNVIAFFIVAFVSGYLTSRIKKQESALSERAYTSSVLYEFSKSLGSAESNKDIAAIARESFERVFKCEIEILLKDQSNELQHEPVGSNYRRIDPKEFAVATWSFKNQKNAGWGTETLNSSKCLSVPLKGRNEMIGVILIWPKKGEKRNPEFEFLIETFVSNTAMALEREMFEEKSKEADVLASSEKLHQALLSSVSHELKTPLTAIIGNATALKQKEQSLSDSGREQALGDLIESSERLNRVVENLLDMTRISSGALKVRDDLFELNDFTDSSLNRYASVLKHHKISFQKSDQEVFVRGDDKLLEHVISNLLSNAAYYSPRGSEIKVQVLHNETHGKVVVIDEGPGIPQDSTDKIFERFYRVPGTPTGGTGLGLSIAKALVIAMSGTIEVQNRTDRSGSAFTFSLPRSTIRFDKDGKLN